MTTPLKGLKNIGKGIEQKLNEIDIYSREDLEQVGAVRAWQYLQQAYPDQTIPVCYYLSGLEGALRNVHWNDLPKVLKDKLLKQAKG